MPNKETYEATPTYKRIEFMCRMSTTSKKCNKTIIRDICEGSQSQIKRHESPLLGHHQSKTNIQPQISL